MFQKSHKFKKAVLKKRCFENKFMPITYLIFHFRRIELANNSNIMVSQSNAAMSLRCGGICNDGFGAECNDVTMPFILSALYMLKLNRSIADTSRQSYMHMIACRIRRHQNRMGPSLSERLTVLNRKRENC